MAYQRDDKLVEEGDIRACKTCGTEFVARKGYKNYCSTECQMKARKILKTWNKGMTKETSEKVKETASKISKAMKDKHRKKKLLPWNANLTAEDSPSIAKMSKRLKFTNNDLIIVNNRAYHKNDILKLIQANNHEKESLRSSIDNPIEFAIKDRMIAEGWEHRPKINGWRPHFVHRKQKRIFLIKDDYFSCNPDIFGAYDYNPHLEMVAKDRWDMEARREEEFEDKGYKVEVRWVSEFQDLNMESRELKRREEQLSKVKKNKKKSED